MRTVDRTCRTWWAIATTGACGRVGLVHGRPLQEPLHQPVDAAVQGGREEHPLARPRGLGQQSGDAGQEAEVSHVVGLVEDGDLDRVEPAQALLDEILQTAGAGDEDVDTGLQRLGLGLLADSAEDGPAAQSGDRSQRLQRSVDLGGELTGGSQDHRSGLAGTRLRRRCRQPGDQRQQEGVGLAGAGAAPAEDIPAGDGIREGRGLDRGGSDDVAIGEYLRQGRGHAERAERRAGRQESTTLVAVSPGWTSAGAGRHGPQLEVREGRSGKLDVTGSSG